MVSKRRMSKPLENKENMELDQIEAETARLHRHFVEGDAQPDSASRYKKEKRPVSDNSRPL